jgi:hypothetical protein
MNSKILYSCQIISNYWKNFLNLYVKKRDKDLISWWKATAKQKELNKTSFNSIHLRENK